MSTLPETPLILTTVVVDAATARTVIDGDLDFDTAGELVTAVEDGLAAQPGLRDLHLDCGRLGVCDSVGLSVLLTVHRRTSAAGVRLHLDDRPPALDRLLEVTGTLEFLTADPAAGAEERADPRERQTGRPSAGPPNA
ncbi:STAS domain-containing protein [Streptomyces sp. NBC_01476]|uniref:STAS domain-containing protein n=1 Tax=Streptomyces sp. NBC_01476 TaxID=2903881 RepID=UPI002E37B193|nr:STAS domain-containing protein [Streptomyces sp. NBC_01476]